QEFVTSYVKGCRQVNHADSIMNQSFTPSEIYSLCTCAGTYVSSKITDQDIINILKSNSYESIFHITNEAYELCTKSLLEQKGLSNKLTANRLGTTPDSNDSSLIALYNPKYATQSSNTPSDRKARQIEAENHPIFSALFSGITTTIALSAKTASFLTKTFGLSDFSRGLENTARDLFEDASVKPSLMQSSAINSASDIIIFVIANLFYLIGLGAFPVAAIFLYFAVTAKNKKTD
ncbi:hypothetical protein, partial [Thauera propionica]|uniref:hypothetical protein n=1 Tax=Thauera propionica TaxID=2019431 RepID=UPI0023F266ED